MDSSGDDPAAAALAWLLASEEPAVRYLTRRELLDDRDGAAAAADAAQLLEGPKARALLAGQQPDGGFGGPSVSEVDRGPLAASVAGGAGRPGRGARPAGRRLDRA
jgi:hypothetical protein